MWSELPGLLISAVFATMFLGAQIPSPMRAARLLEPQLSLGLTFASGQYVVGIRLMILVLSPLFGVPHMFGALIEIAQMGPYPLLIALAVVLVVAVASGLFYFGRNPMFAVEGRDGSASS